METCYTEVFLILLFCHCLRAYANRYTAISVNFGMKGKSEGLVQHTKCRVTAKCMPSQDRATGQSHCLRSRYFLTFS